MSIIANITFGSHLYGTDTNGSDSDHVIIYAPTVDDWILNKISHHNKTSTGDSSSKNNNADVDIDTYSVQRLIEDSILGKTWTVDVLHCPEPAFYTEAWTNIINQRHLFVTKTMVHEQLRYIHGQVSRYGPKQEVLDNLIWAVSVLKSLPKTDRITSHMQLLKSNGGAYEQIFTKFGNTHVSNVLSAVQKNQENIQKMMDAGKNCRHPDFDWKRPHHAMRVAYQTIALLEHGDFSYPLADATELIDIKLGKRKYSGDVKEQLESLVDKIITMLEVSDIPDHSDPVKCESIVLNIFHDLYNS